LTCFERLSSAADGGCAAAPTAFFPLLTPVSEVFAILLLSDDAAFCAAEKTDEKKPPCPDGALATPGALINDRVSSIVGVSGGDMWRDRRLGFVEIDADCTRRCADECPALVGPPAVCRVRTLTLPSGQLGAGAGTADVKPACFSVGVGGVTVVTGVTGLVTASDLGVDGTLAAAT
jgi:hypothetical protein